jgi:hypothetical protein
MYTYFGVGVSAHLGPLSAEIEAGPKNLRQHVEGLEDKASKDTLPFQISIGVTAKGPNVVFLEDMGLPYYEAYLSVTLSEIMCVLYIAMYMLIANPTVAGLVRE